ncbi:MAG: hypothetical protein J5899_00245, partial [Acidaminococcaceae bacterium]|nr:hypothetical protein [Acidaminococcaceae bacterium]
MTKRRTKKYLAARIVCSLVLGAYLVGGYCEPVAWGEPEGNGAKIQGNSVTADATESSAWGHYAKASGKASTAWGTNTTASGIESSAWGYKTTASGE